LNSFTNGQWQSYDFSDAISSPTSNLGFAGIEIMLNQNTVFVGSLNNGVIGYNLTTGESKAIYDEISHNLPSASIYALALDRSNQLWIGTQKGLRILYNTSNFFDADNVTTEAIIFLEDGIPQELLEQQFISDIKVDGSNNKWIGTIGAGSYYFSSE
jgi:ligand-binding sensor domain-containing protein